MGVGINPFGVDVMVTSLQLCVHCGGRKTAKQVEGNRRGIRGKMPCYVVGCQNRTAKKDYPHFYRIPSSKMPLEAKRRCLWLQAINKQTGHMKSPLFITQRQNS